jgi:hypothetical protein
MGLLSSFLTTTRDTAEFVYPEHLMPSCSATRFGAEISLLSSNVCSSSRFYTALPTIVLRCFPWGRFLGLLSSSV